MRKKYDTYKYTVTEILTQANKALPCSKQSKLVKDEIHNLV